MPVARPGVFPSTRGIALSVALLAFAAPVAAHESGRTSTGIGHRLVAAYELPNVPGKRLTVVTVDFAPGAKSPAHHHSGFVFAYVLSGAIRSQLAGQPARVYRAGEHFSEPPGSRHLVAENASATHRARLLVVFVADDKAKLTTYLHAQRHR